MYEGPNGMPSAEMLARLHNRRDSLKLLGAAGIGAAGASLLPGTAEGAVRTRLQPTDFSFRPREQFRPFHFDGYLDAPHPTNILHPMIVPIPIRSRRRTKYIMITFNGDQYYIERLGYGTHGDFYVMQAEQTVRGYEFPPR